MKKGIKHISWQHEKEFRALVPVEYGNFFPIIPRKIYLGMNASKEHEDRLLQIVNKFPACELYKMKEALDDNNFYLNNIKIH